MPFWNLSNSIDISAQNSISRSVSLFPVTMPLTTKRSGRPSRSASTKTQPQDHDVSQTPASFETRSKRSPPRLRKREEPRDSAVSRRQTSGRPSEYGNGGMG